MHRVGIRCENKNEWERRAPLTPDHVEQLVERGVEIVVQPSRERVFPEKDYRAAGATIADSLEGCRVILGVKEIPPERIAEETTYLYFSHTTKAQRENMPALARLLERRATLIDYEQVVDDRRRRLIFFGRHAGYAGMIDALWALGRRLDAEGHETELRRIRLAHEYTSLDEATAHLWRVAERVRHNGLPDAIDPLVVAFTGSGNVTRGAEEILDRLPTVELVPHELPGLAADAGRPRNVLYKVRIPRELRFERIDGGPTDLDELERHPRRYRSGLVRWLPQLTMVVHGAYWRPPQPRLIGAEHIRALWSADRTPRLRVIVDISCDIRGGIEITERPTTPGEPVFVWDVERGKATAGGVEGRGPVLLAIDNLPCQLSVESSEHFGDTLMRFVPALAKCDWSRPLDELALPPVLQRAIVTHAGRLAPQHARLDEALPRR